MQTLGMKVFREEWKEERSGSLTNRLSGIRKSHSQRRVRNIEGGYN